MKSTLTGVILTIIFSVNGLLSTASQSQILEKEVIYYIAETHQSWQIFRTNLDETNIRLTHIAPNGVLKLFLTTDDQKILFITEDFKIYVLDQKTEKKAEILIDNKGTVDAILSNNNKFLLFSLSTGGSNDANHIWMTDITANKTTQLTHMKGMQHGPIWSHDEKSVFFISGDGGQNEDIWRMNIETGSLNQLTSNNRYNFELACSVNDEIAFSSNRSGNYEIWAMDPFGGNVRQLTHNPAMDSQPSWSPDGEHLVFVSTRDGEPALYIMDRDGNNTRRLTPEGLICRNPVWSR